MFGLEHKPQVQDPATASAWLQAPRLSGLLLVKEPELSYYNPEPMFFTVYSYHGDLM